MTTPQKLLRRFDSHAAQRRSTLVALCGEAEADQVIADARQEYETLCPEIAQLGGGLMNGSLAGTYEYLGFYKALAHRGYSVEQIGGFYADSWYAMVSRFPSWLPRLVFRLAKPLLAWKLRREAAESQSSDDPRAWRFEYVEGEKQGHDFGMDVTNCAVCSLYARHEASEVVPYLCALDDHMSVVLGMGLQRTGTRAVGASCCDFRYRAGGEPKTLSSQYSLPVVSSQRGD